MKTEPENKKPRRPQKDASIEEENLRPDVKLMISTARGGVRPGVNIDNSQALADFLEDRRFLEF